MKTVALFSLVLIAAPLIPLGVITDSVETLMASIALSLVYIGIIVYNLGTEIKELLK